ncbi:MAG: hypothetical protein A2X12_10810 [Bacteroidetes bacterium GWE2_29_8]|nr:MAG: hypothetical protein A2X12_10810 [Bacteroidetes bacterium GWE2_29_8]OFY17413.1 MAG: hypothetical protein A2X02_00765 [Bacteroidetes bacterium GWF2_29_10]
METKLRRLIIFFVAIALTSNVFAQNLSNSFKNSYAFEKKGEYNNAIEAIKKNYDEKSYEINLRLGWLYYMSGLFTESSSYYNKSIMLKAYSIEAKLGLVLPASALGNWEIVKKQYNDILKIDPNNTTANYRLGNIYYGNKDYQNALKHFEKVANLYPFDYDATLMLAWTSFKLGKTKEAAVLFNKVLIIQPDDASANEGLKSIK